MTPDDRYRLFLSTLLWMPSKGAPANILDWLLVFVLLVVILECF